MTTDQLIVKTTARITFITLNRPDKRNALNAELISGLKQTLIDLASDDATQVLLINGNGNHFCAGADIGWMSKLITEHSYDENYEDAQRLADTLYLLYSFPKPTIGIAHGSTLGGGMGLLSACDIAIASDDSIFGLPEVKIGMSPSTISPYVIAAMGERAAHYYFLTGESFSAAEALHMGLIHKLAPKLELNNTGENIAKIILNNGQKAIRATKQLIRYVAKEKIDKALVQKTAEHLTELRLGQEAKEGLTAFLEKRTPDWR